MNKIKKDTYQMNDGTIVYLKNATPQDEDNLWILYEWDCGEKLLHRLEQLCK